MIAFSPSQVSREGALVSWSSRESIRVKNLEGLLRAMTVLLRDGLAPTLLVAGTGDSDYVAGLRDLARREGIQDLVHWLGHVGGRAKDDLLAAADVFVLPSYSENFGMAALEAMAAGLPCILGRNVGLAEEVRSSGAGVIVDTNPESIAAGIRHFLLDPHARESSGAAGLALAQQNFSLERMGRASRLSSRTLSSGTAP